MIGDLSVHEREREVTMYILPQSDLTINNKNNRNHINSDITGNYTCTVLTSVDTSLCLVFTHVRYVPVQRVIVFRIARNGYIRSLGRCLKEVRRTLKWKLFRYPAPSKHNPCAELALDAWSMAKRWLHDHTAIRVCVHVCACGLLSRFQVYVCFLLCVYIVYSVKATSKPRFMPPVRHTKRCQIS